MAESVGFIGLGAMGTAMVLQLLQDGRSVTVWNRSAAATETAVSAGAEVADSPAEVFRRHPVTLSMLANDEAYEKVFSDTVLGAARGRVHVNMATISVELADRLTRRHSEFGAEYLAAPVLGRPEVAARGELGIVTGGPQQSTARVHDILSVLGAQIWHVGERPAQANLVKIGVNYNLVHALVALGESLTLVERGGADAEQFVDVLTASAFAGTAYGAYGPMIARRAYRPAGFAVDLGIKDIMLTQAAAATVKLRLPMASTLRGLFDAAASDPSLADGDWSIVAEVIRGSHGDGGTLEST